MVMSLIVWLSLLDIVAAKVWCCRQSSILKNRVQEAIALLSARARALILQQDLRGKAGLGTSLLCRSDVPCYWDY